MKHPRLILLLAALSASSAATTTEPANDPDETVAPTSSAHPVTCCVEGTCFTVSGLAECHERADSIRAMAHEAFDEEVREANQELIVDDASSFVDMRDDIRTFEARILRCIEEVVPSVKNGVRYMAGEYAVCEVALDVCASDVDAEKGLVAWRVVERETADFVQPRIGEILSVFTDWQGRTLDGAAVATHSYTSEASCTR